MCCLGRLHPFFPLVAPGVPLAARKRGVGENRTEVSKRVRLPNYIGYVVFYLVGHDADGRGGHTPRPYSVASGLLLALW